MTHREVAAAPAAFGGAFSLLTLFKEVFSGRLCIIIFFLEGGEGQVNLGNYALIPRTI